MQEHRLAVLAALAVSFPALGTTWIVNPGESIQHAVDQADPGDTILVLPGTYQEAGRTCPSDPRHQCGVVITTDDLHVVGASQPGEPVLLEKRDDQDEGIEVAVPVAHVDTCLDDPSQRIQGSTLEGLTVNGFGDNGIYLFCVDHFTIRNCETHDNVEYGLFPSHSAFGSIIGNVATGANDTGIYVGESHDVRVTHNIAHGNVSGFEIENSSQVELDHNLAVGNTAGILSFTLPFLDVPVNEDNSIHHNTAILNNKDNTCTGGDVCLVPIGTGILLISVQATNSSWASRWWTCAPLSRSLKNFAGCLGSILQVALASSATSLLATAKIRTCSGCLRIPPAPICFGRDWVKTTAGRATFRRSTSLRYPSPSVSKRGRPQRCRSRNDCQLPSAVHPPSTTSVCPLTNPLCASSARNAIALATSSGVANRAIGTRPVMSASL